MLFFEVFNNVLQNFCHIAATAMGIDGEDAAVRVDHTLTMDGEIVKQVSGQDQEIEEAEVKREKGKQKTEDGGNSD